NPLVLAIKSLTQGTQNLLKHHIELAKHEAKADALEIGKDITGVIVAVGLALMGYLLLNFAAVLFSAWLAGITGMAIRALILALIHLVGGGIAAKTLVENVQRRYYGMNYTGKELERSTAWVKETKE
ncbi:unnamed protein product, partial [Laminaria digitata]